MKNLLIVSFLIMCNSSCKKVDFNKNNDRPNETVSTVIEESIEKAAPSRGEKACVIFSTTDSTSQAGKRCGTPTGNCGKYSSCAAVEKSMRANWLPKGMSLLTFNAMMQTEEGSQALAKLGYTAKDL